MKQMQAMWAPVFERNEARDPAELKAEGRACKGRSED
jgi:hypothetical protein